MAEEDKTLLLSEINAAQNQFTVVSHTFQTDVLPGYQHFSPIRKLKFVTKIG
jgi:hypothetical protein